MTLVELMEFVCYTLTVFSAGVAVGKYLHSKNDRR